MMLQFRELLDTSTASDTALIVQVSTFQELIDAIEGGYEDIEIIEHMDATSFGLITAPINGLEFKHQLPPQISKTRTIRVRVSPAEPICPTPALLPFSAHTFTVFGHLEGMRQGTYTCIISSSPCDECFLCLLRTSG